MVTSLKRKLKWGLGAHIAFVVTIGSMAYLGLLPFAVQSIHRSADKAMHFLLVGGIAFWLVGIWDDARLELGRLRLPLAVLIPAVLSGVEEAMQALSRRRSADIFDFAADLTGLVVFWLLGRALLRRGRPPLAPPV